MSSKKKSPLQAVLVQAEVKEQAWQAELQLIQRRLDKEQQQLTALESYQQDYHQDIQQLNQHAFTPEKRNSYIGLLQQVAPVIQQQKAILEKISLNKKNAEYECYKAELYCQKLRQKLSLTSLKIKHDQEKKQEERALEEIMFQRVL